MHNRIKKIINKYNNTVFLNRLLRHTDVPWEDLRIATKIFRQILLRFYELTEVSLL